VNGRYNDILKADEHYISLASDYSNLDDVLDRFGDVNYRSNIAKNAHQYVMAYHTYDHRIAELLIAVGF
jgi:spore maturation protein CgeB